MEPFGTIIAEWVGRNRLTVGEAGDRLGVSGATVSRWISGQRAPSLEDAARVADKIGVSLDQLAGLTSRDPIREALGQEITRLGPREVLRRLLAADQAEPASIHGKVRDNLATDARERKKA